MNPDAYTRDAIAAVTAAAREEPDFAGWLASVLCSTAARLGCSDALTARRPGSWAAACVHQLVGGTAGWQDEWLDTFEEAR